MIFALLLAAAIGITPDAVVWLMQMTGVGPWELFTTHVEAK